MKPIYKKRCIIGEGPIFRESDGRLYFVNPVEAKEICSVRADGGDPRAIQLTYSAAAIAFTKDGRILTAGVDGVFMLDETSGEQTPFCDIKGCNDSKVGPDGAFYVGTQSGKRLGISDAIDGKLYRVSADGKATVLLDGLILSNGMDWSTDGKLFYHTDSDTGILKEYDFDIATGSISYTGRSVCVPHLDGMTFSESGLIYVACWGTGHVAVVDSARMEIVKYIDVPVPIPTSCGFFGENMDMLAITTANYNDTARANAESGYTFFIKTDTRGKPPYLFG